MWRSRWRGERDNGGGLDLIQRTGNAAAEIGQAVEIDLGGVYAAVSEKVLEFMDGVAPRFRGSFGLRRGNDWSASTASLLNSMAPRSRLATVVQWTPRSAATPFRVPRFWRSVL